MRERKEVTSQYPNLSEYMTDPNSVKRRNEMNLTCPMVIGLTYVRANKIWKGGQEKKNLQNVQKLVKI